MSLSLLRRSDEGPERDEDEEEEDLPVVSEGKNIEQITAFLLFLFVAFWSF